MGALVRWFARWRMSVAASDRDLFYRAMTLAFMRGDYASVADFRAHGDASARLVDKWRRVAKETP